jgi:tripartite-type tricarboxylate transporter receptor subunit TctC
MEGLNTMTPHAKSGRVRSLGVSGAKRSEALPDVPTIAEAGVPGYEATTWNGIVAPAGIPRAVLARLNAALTKSLTSPTLRERFAAIGADPSPSTPEAFAAFIRSENEKWRDVVKRSGAKVD